jgi:hypothetical protein
VLALWGCTTTVDSTRDQYTVCYDTGHGIKCAQASAPGGDDAVCTDGDGDDATSTSSAEGPSASDDGISESSDAPATGGILDTDGDSAEDASGESDSTEDGGGCGDTTEVSVDSSSTAEGASDSGDGSDSDADDDGVSDDEDCDCVDPDGDGTPPAPPPDEPPAGDPVP